MDIGHGIFQTMKAGGGRVGPGHAPVFGLVLLVPEGHI
jgi:hypothetical protein